MLVRGVSRHQIETYAQAASVGVGYEAFECGIVAEAGIDAVEVGDVVTAVFEPALEHGADPYGIEPDAADIVELGAYALDIAYAVAVAVHIGRGVDVVDDRIAQPCRNGMTRLGREADRSGQNQQ